MALFFDMAGSVLQLPLPLSSFKPLSSLKPCCDACAATVQVHEIVKGIFNKEPSRGVNPDEVVAMGAAIQVGGGF